MNTASIDMDGGASQPTCYVNARARPLHWLTRVRELTYSTIFGASRDSGVQRRALRRYGERAHRVDQRVPS